MKIYFAGYSVMPEITQLIPSVLESYLLFRRDPQLLLDSVRDNNINDFFLDSGAFSAFTQGTQIDIDDYIKFCHVVKDHVNVISNLDVIGDPEATYKNWCYMREKGINALPVIHYGSDEKYFDLYFKQHKEPYVALGGLVPYTRQQNLLREWLDTCFYHIKDHFPVKIHLFGVISPWVLKRYPAYSCDGTSWLMGGKFGATYSYKDMKIKPSKLESYYSNTKDYKYRNLLNVQAYDDLRIDITKLWDARGIHWND